MAEKLRCYTITDGSDENPGILERDGILSTISTILDDDYILEDGKTLTITISRHDMTQREIDALPEI